MRTRMTGMVLAGILLFACGLAPSLAEAAQTNRLPVVKNMDITGEIAKMGNNYIIRGKVPAEVFTILNPDPGMFAALEGKTVHFYVRIVAGDNVEIEKIDGKDYGKKQSAK